MLALLGWLALMLYGVSHETEGNDTQTSKNSAVACKIGFPSNRAAEILPP